MRRHHDFMLVIALLVSSVFSSACTAWHTTSLQPQRFSAENSPAEVRLILSNGAEVTVGHPVMVGDSLVWSLLWGEESPRDSGRSGVLTSSIRQAKVHGVDAARTIGLLMVLGGVVGGFYALVSAIGNGIASGS
jgi:hypothetical protein